MVAVGQRDACVRRTAASGRDAGDHLEGDIGLHQLLHLLTTAAKHEGVAPFEPDVQQTVGVPWNKLKRPILIALLWHHETEQHNSTTPHAAVRPSGGGSTLAVHTDRAFSGSKLGGIGADYARY